MTERTNQGAGLPQGTDELVSKESGAGVLSAGILSYRWSRSRRISPAAQKQAVIVRMAM
jgi:hypothetical protein